MATAGQVFKAAMALMDELGTEGGQVTPYTENTEDYAHRAPDILNILTGERRILSGKHGLFIPVESLDDDITGIEEAYALTVMPYGLAASLLVDENPAAASYFLGKYEELMVTALTRTLEVRGLIRDVYGGIQYEEAERW